MATAFLFTGQGSQFAGMGRELAEASSAAREVFAEADEALGEPLSQLCFEGPDDALALTANTQPCTLAVSLAAYRALGQQTDFVAGHSLGEYSALTAAGALDLSTAIKLVRERANRMQEAVPAGTGGMVALRKTDRKEAEEIAAKVTRGICDVANLNTPGQVVLSGETAAMDEVEELVGPRKAVRLQVSVPFHSSLLKKAAEGFAEVLADVELRDPAFPVVCNVDAKPLRHSDEIRDALVRQFAGSVRWQESVEWMLREGGIDRFVEFGPKPTLTKMTAQIAKAIEVDGFESFAVCDAEGLSALQAG
ncbi:MAG: ACP S-malonyltransferase [Planctomycetota bacterium]